MDQSELLSEILEDYLARIRQGEAPDPGEYVLRYPMLSISRKRSFLDQ